MKCKYGKRCYSNFDGRITYKHVQIWEDFMETPVPFDEKGKRCVIHHIDEDKTNNEITNLACMTRKEHFRIHKKTMKTNKGKKMSEDFSRQISERQIGRKLSEATKEKIRQTLTGKKMSDERRKHMSESAKKRYHKE